MIVTSKAPKAIIFFGPDGSGKTTQTDLLIQRLRKDGVSTRRLWLRSLHTLAFVISKIAMHVLGLESVYDFRSKYSHIRSFRPLWYAIEFISILPLVLFRFYIPLARRQTVVAERYVIDWVVSLSYASSNESLLDSILAKAVLRFMPKDSLLIYIDADYDTIYSRGRRDDSSEFIEFQRRFYAKIAQIVNAVIINTSDKTVQEVHELIYQSTQCSSIRRDATS